MEPVGIVAELEAELELDSVFELGLEDESELDESVELVLLVLVDGIFEFELLLEF